jgi:hypothetical protein
MVKMVQRGYVQSREHVDARIDKRQMTMFGTRDRKQYIRKTNYSKEFLEELEATNYKNLIDFYIEDLVKVHRGGYRSLTELHGDWWIRNLVGKGVLVHRDGRTRGALYLSKEAEKAVLEYLKANTSQPA